MQPTRIQKLFESVRKENRSALIAYVTAGDPSPERTPEIVAALERGGVDLIELGVPFSDPIADGPVKKNWSLHEELHLDLELRGLASCLLDDEGEK